MTLGIIVGVLIMLGSHMELKGQISLDSEFFYTVILPPIIFEVCFQFLLFDNWTFLITHLNCRLDMECHDRLFSKTLVRLCRWRFWEQHFRR